jgi:demethylmenaquinone methyltransferase/2-methoxy-6-polyprenyl-1,4-benzoquinol methylase
MRLRTGRAEAGQLMRYYWDTIAECVPPETILDVLRQSGFIGVERRVSAGIISEYVGAKPRP